MGATVVVEPDSIGPWIGLAGVVLGAMLSTGATWLQRRFSQRKEELRELRRAASEVVASARNLAAIISAGPLVSGSGLELALAQAERVQIATDVLRRLAPDRVFDAADRVAEVVFLLIDRRGGTVTQVSTAVDDFDKIRISAGL